MRTKKRDFSRVVSLSLTLILVVVFSDESSERRQESITYSAKCFGGCFPHLRTSTKTKVFRALDSSCYQLCLKKIKATRRQQFPAFAHSRRKRTRKERSPATKCPTSSPSQNVNWYPSEVNVSFGKYENTNQWFSNLSWTLMNDTHGNWTAVLVRFAVSHKSAVAPDLTCFLYPKNQTDLTLNISAYGFRYPDYLFLLQISGFPFTQDALSVMETYEPNLSTTTTHPPGSSTKEKTATVVDFRYKRSTTKKSNDSYLYISISVGVLVGLGLVAVGLLVHFLRSKPDKSNNPLPQDFRYHAFIIFNSGDQRWMKTKLLPLLEEKHHLSCCIHYRDFAVGKPFRDSMAESVYNSHKVIALFSSNFVKSNYCKYELDLAIGRLLSHRDRCLAVIRIDKVDSNMLPKELKDKSFIDYSNATERRIWKRKLLEFLRLPGDEECHDSDVNQNCKINSTNDDNGERLESASSMESDAHQEHPNADMDEISDLSSTNGNRERIRFMRLESTVSNDTVISVV